MPSEMSNSVMQLFENLSNGTFQNIVVCTGAGVSTAAGIPDFRSKGGMYETLVRDYGECFPQAKLHPEWLLSRSFAQAYPDVWEEIMLPRIQADYAELQPTMTHEFCAWLHQRGWLRRIYTQNVDGLHLHPSLNIPTEKVVECHGSMRNGNLVLYGDPISTRVVDCCDQDFGDNNVDLMLVMGTSLQVAPFCAIPNMALKGCTRVLVNACIQDCLRNDCNGFVTTMTRIGKRKHVSLKSLWNDVKANRKWNQLLVETKCDDFVRHFYSFVDASSKANVKSEA
jgi:NAD-dependent SIR2 family protein deacetylase